MPQIDPFEVPKTAIPDYASYRWVRKQFFGQVDRQSLDDAAAAGYRPVPKQRHWNLPAAKTWDRDTDFAEYGGLILMERPDWMTMQAEAELRRRSYDLVRPPHAPAMLPPKKTLWQRLRSALGA